jgi:hypothetical protein
MPEVWEQEGHVRAGAFLRGDFQEELKSYASTLGLAKIAGWRRR